MRTGNNHVKETFKGHQSRPIATIRAVATGTAIAKTDCVLDNPMRADARNVADLVTRMQQAFFDLPDLALTPADACVHFGADEHACGAVLDLLADANVLTKRSDGAYVRVVRDRGALRDVTPRRPAMLTLPRSVAFISRDELARLASHTRRVA